ncbi:MULTISPECIES: DUF4190 domain-containing protein [unclassified Corynebacterium]|uniref:DUF4190 domain-containing protein n=1 Tax=unclassified Corynebacterium TaxID=2624378 RepID=UPI0034CE1BBC
MTTPNNPYGNDQNNDPNQGLPSYGDSRPGANDAQGQHAADPGAGAGTGSGYGYGGTGEANAGFDGGAYGAAPEGYGASPEGNAYAAPAAGYGGSQYQGGFENAPNFEKSKLALTALILGIVAVVGLIVGGLGAIVGVAGVVVSIIAMARNAKKPKEARRTWMSVVGFILSVISIAIAAIMVAFTVWVFNETNFEECMQLQDQQEQRECVERQSEELVNSNN